MAKTKQGKKADRDPERQPENQPENQPDMIELPAPRAELDHELDHELLVLETIARELDLSRDDITGDVGLQTDLGVGDEQIPQLLTAMGEALDVRFPDDFLDGVTTVAQLTAAVRVSLSPL